jgi:chromosome segregation ATPase
MSSESGWVTTDVAARAVRVSPRTIRRYIDQGKLEGKLEGEGVRREWLVSVDSLHALRASRPEEEESPRVDREPALADSLADVLRDMAARLELRAEEAAELRVRLELIERTQSTLEDERRRALEELERERAERLGAQERADQLEEERGRLVARYEQTDEEVRELREELEAERSKGLWRRLFGG